jgi:hypothetical protein
MFVQVIQGRVSDAEEYRAAIERWVRDIGPHAIGWLGSTSGVTADGIGITVARFESEESARANSNRPEQHTWWMETAKLFSGDVTFHDSREVYEVGDGGSDNAGFVQIIQGRTTDPKRLIEIMRRTEEPLRQSRPDVLGGLVCLHDDNLYTDVFYFTSETEARAAEGREPPADAKALLEEEATLAPDPTYFDLAHPWLHSPHS